VRVRLRLPVSPEDASLDPAETFHLQSLEDPTGLLGAVSSGSGILPDVIEIRGTTTLVGLLG